MNHLILSKIHALSSVELNEVLFKMIASGNPTVLDLFATHAGLDIDENVTFAINNNSRVVDFVIKRSTINQLLHELQTGVLAANNKVGFIKRTRELTGLALLEAKLFSESGITKYTSVGWE